MNTAPSIIDVLLVEDTPEDVELTLEAFSEHISLSRIQVARDGVQFEDFARVVNEIGIY